MEKKHKIGFVILFVGFSVVIGLYILSNQLQVSKDRFGIYLSENDELVISDKDIVWYNLTSHEIKLDEEGIGRIQGLDLYQKQFTVKLDGKEIYKGSFWSYVSSIPYSGVVILDILEVQSDPLADTIKIQAGYPNPEFFEGTDPRNDSEILDYFENYNK